MEVAVMFDFELGRTQVPKYFFGIRTKVARSQRILRWMPFISFLLVTLFAFMLGQYSVTYVPNPNPHQPSALVSTWIVFSLGILTLTVVTGIKMAKAREYLARFSIFISEAKEFYRPYVKYNDTLEDQETGELFSEDRLKKLAEHRLRVLGAMVYVVENAHEHSKYDNPHKPSLERAKWSMKAQFERSFEWAKGAQLLKKDAEFGDYIKEPGVDRKHNVAIPDVGILV